METIIVSCTLQEIGETQQTPPLALFYVIKISGPALNDPVEGINLTLLNYPRLCPRHHILWKPSGEVSSLQNEPGGDECTH